MLRNLMRIERNAHWHPLHDLDPVAGRVLRGQQREGGARAGAEPGYLAMITEAAAIKISTQGHGLADAHRGQLGLLEVRIHPDLVERHDRHQRRTGADALTELYSPPRDES